MVSMSNHNQVCLTCVMSCQFGSGRIINMTDIFYYDSSPNVVLQQTYLYFPFRNEKFFFYWDCCIAWGITCVVIHMTVTLEVVVFTAWQ